MRAMKILYFVGLSLSLLIGIWHFTVPYMFGWYGYIPDAPTAIVVSIDWVNFFFSLLLSGTSLLLIIFHKRVFSANLEMNIFYGFLTFVWFCRVLITFIEPYPYEPVAFMAIIQQVIAILIFLIMLAPFIYFVRLLARCTRK
jgi:hypothetical protein